MITTILKGSLFPLLLIGSFYAFDQLIENGWHPGIALFVSTLVSLAVIAGLERLLPYRKDWAWWTDGQVINDLIHGAALSTIGPRLGEIGFASLAATGAAWAATVWNGGIWPAAWPIWAQVVLAILIADFFDWA